MYLICTTTANVMMVLAQIGNPVVAKTVYGQLTAVHKDKDIFILQDVREELFKE